MAVSHAASLAPCPAQTCSRSHTALPQGCLHLPPAKRGEAGTRRGRPARCGAGVGAVGPWKLRRGLCCTKSCCSGTQAWGPTRGRRNRRRRHQSWPLPIPGGPRTLWGESRRGLGTRHLRSEAGEPLPLEAPRWGRRTDTPMLGSAPGTFWVNGEKPGCSPRPPGLHQSVRGPKPAALSKAPPPPLAQEAPAGQAGAWLHLAEPCSSSQPAHPRPPSCLAQPCLSSPPPRLLPGCRVSPDPF